MYVKNCRDCWLEWMLRIAKPVLRNLAAGTLHKNIPMDFHPDREPYVLLEAFGRTAEGIAPWLELEGLTGEEAEKQQEYRGLMWQSIDNATNPASPDYMNFSEGYGQALVDAAFLAHAILRAPKQMYECLDVRVQRQLVTAFRATRVFVPYRSNWLLFSAMVEAALYVMGEKDYDLVRVEYAVQSFETWYVGDGTYGDGAYFHWDYYNSFVIHPMYVDILRTFAAVREDYRILLPEAERRSARYAGVLEQLIGPDGTYPVMGRSATYRFGAFQLLSQAVLEGFLPDSLSASQVRSALTAVIAKVMEGNMFDEEGWLVPGIYGYQPDMAEGYICVGSLYLCMSVFLPMGLFPGHEFWKGEDMDWTSKKIWSGQKTVCDHAVD